jgi:hypothetical protein
MRLLNVCYKGGWPLAVDAAAAHRDPDNLWLACNDETLEVKNLASPAALRIVEEGTW